MLSQRATLSLSSFISDEDEVVLIGSTEWLCVRRESDYREIGPRQALWMLEGMDRRYWPEVRRFVAECRLGSFQLQRMDDAQVLTLLREAVRDGRVMAIQKGAPKSEAPSATVEMRRLVAQVEKDTRGKLSFRGRLYKVITDVDLAKLPGRDYYEVVSQSEAREVLDGVAKESPASAETVRKASDKISKDWRTPISQPDGLVLLRKIPINATSPKDDGAAITPSQMKALLTKSGWIEIEAVCDDEEEPYTGPYRLELPDGSIASGTFDKDGFLGKYDIDNGTCKISFTE